MLLGDRRSWFFLHRRSGSLWNLSFFWLARDNGRQLRFIWDLSSSSILGPLWTLFLLLGRCLFCSLFCLNPLRRGSLSFILSLHFKRMIISNRKIKLVYYFWPDRRLGHKGRNCNFLSSTFLWAGLRMKYHGVRYWIKLKGFLDPILCHSNDMPCLMVYVIDLLPVKQGI